VGEALLETDLPLPNRRQGKVRDLYDIVLPDGREGVLLVATDRISAYDVVLANGVPGKGVVLTRIAKFWFDWVAERFGDRLPHHLLSDDAEAIPGLDAAWRSRLAGRVMVCRKLEVVPVECIARGYLAGSGYRDYRRTGSVCGVPLPQGLVNGDALPEPIFTPSTKAVDGHDENVTFEAAAERVGRSLATRLQELTLALYAAAREYAEARGVIVADTKLEFGFDAEGGLRLADEILTPDSSRFWPRERWVPGAEQESFDKQPVRDHLARRIAAGEWNGQPPGPALPEEVVGATQERYLEAYRRLTGAELALP